MSFDQLPDEVRLRALPAMALALVLGTGSLRASETSFRRDVYPVLAARCLKCHGPEEKSGNVDFSAISDDRAAGRQRKLWRKALARVDAAEMPPADEPQLSDDERSRLLDWMKATIENIDGSDPANRSGGPAPARRLSLAEYNRTVRDLLAFEFDAASAAGIADESGEANTYGNMAEALEVSPALMDKYFAAADAILDRLFGTELSSSIDGRIQEDARVSRETLFGLKPGQWRDPATQISPPEGGAPRDAAEAMLGTFVRKAYRGQATAEDLARLMRLYDRAAVKGNGYVESVRLALKAVLVSPKFLYRLEPDRPDRRPGESYAVSDHELAVRLSYFLWSSMPDEELLDLADRAKLSAAGPSQEAVCYPGKVIGAAGSENHQGNNRDNVFDGDRQTFLDGPTADSHWIGLDLGEARPVTRIRYAGRPAHENRMVGGKIQASASPDFAEVVELFEVAEPPRGYAVCDLGQPANYRYFRYLPPKGSWGNVAEIELRGPAAGTVLEQQVARMLADRRARALTENFAVRWLQINKLPDARPSVEFFPEFNGNLRKAAHDEAEAFLDAIRRDNRSVLELLDANYTFVNEDLAKYYGLTSVPGREMRRVELKPEDHRGGLLGMASVLALTSHTSRTSPTMRGKWILQVVLGTPPPPPPANVSQIKDERDKKNEALTFRDKLTEYAKNAACAACHHKMDPLGFALDNYNAVGVWRERIGDRPIDSSGELPGGEKLNGVADLKRVLLTHKDQFVHNMAEQLLIYALGRELDYYDDCAVRDIAERAKAGGYRYAELIMGVVESYAFRNRTNQ